MDSLYHGLNHCIHLVPSCFFFFFCSQPLYHKTNCNNFSVKSCCLCSLSQGSAIVEFATFSPFLFLLGIIQDSAPQTDVVVAVDSPVSRVCSLLEAWCFRFSLDVAAVDSPVPTVCSLPEASFFKRDVVAVDSRISRVCSSTEASSSRGDVCRRFSYF
jgi:hypothetical protein